MLEAFAKWFASAKGVWQTFLVCMVAVGAEAIWPNLDEHMFYLMAILTVYSAITQPALAYVAVQADNRMTCVLRHLEELVDRDISIDQEELEVIKKLAGK